MKINPTSQPPDLNPPLKWHGGKWYLAQWIISHMPTHTHYVDVYGGGLSVLLSKNYVGVSEVVNDLNGDLMNFWRVLASPKLFEKFNRAVEATPFSQKLFETALTYRGKNKVERAIFFFVKCRQSRQGLCKDFATLSKNRTRREMNEQVSSWLTAIEGLEDIHNRLKRVVLFNTSALALIKKEDSPNTLFYLDPPYLPETRVTKDNYEFEMSEGDHIDLLNALVNIEGKFLLSGYYSDLYNDFTQLYGWNFVSKEIDCKASSSKNKPKRVEYLWKNY